MKITLPEKQKDVPATILRYSQYAKSRWPDRWGPPYSPCSSELEVKLRCPPQRILRPLLDRVTSEGARPDFRPVLGFSTAAAGPGKAFTARDPARLLSLGLAVPRADIAAKEGFRERFFNGSRVFYFVN